MLQMINHAESHFLPKKCALFVNWLDGRSTTSNKRCSRHDKEEDFFDKPIEDHLLYIDEGHKSNLE